MQGDLRLVGEPLEHGARSASAPEEVLDDHLREGDRKLAREDVVVVSGSHTEADARELLRSHARTVPPCSRHSASDGTSR